MYSALVVGLGRIGAGYDYNSDHSKTVTTHASALNTHTDFCLVGGVDRDSSARARFVEKFHLPAFYSLSHALCKISPQIIVIATPTISHLPIFLEAITAHPKAIIVEKPFGANLQDTETMARVAKVAGVTLLINYVRRYEPGTNILKQKIADGLFGEIYNGSVVYCKGLMNNGSHFIDLLDFLIGEVGVEKVIKSGSRVNISGIEDIEPDFVVTCGKARIIFSTVRSEHFSLLRLTLYGTRGVIQYGDGEILFRLVDKAPNMDITQLSQNEQSIPTDFERYQWHVLTALAGALDGNIGALQQGEESAINTMKIIGRINEI